jgi:site-specific DNA recombinase
MNSAKVRRLTVNLIALTIGYSSNQAHGWICVGTFDDNESGYDYERREMDKVWKLAKEGRINALVVYERDRFSRGEAASIILEEHFHKHGVRLFSVREGEFSKGVKNRIVQAVERAQGDEMGETLKRKLRQGRYDCVVKEGAHPSAGTPIYGYEKDGMGKRCRYVICEETSEVVRLIYSLYIQRWTLARIADYLNEQQIPQPSQRQKRDGTGDCKHKCERKGWTYSIVKNVIQHAEAYHGEHVFFNHTERDEAPDPIVVQIPAIIDDVTYKKVVYIRDQKRAATTTRHPRRPIPFILVGRFHCACGQSLSSITSPTKGLGKENRGQILHWNYYYRCNSVSAGRNTACPVQSMNAERAEETVWQFLKSLLHDPRVAAAKYKRQQAAMQRRLEHAQAHIDSIDEVLTELNGEREQVIALFRKRIIDEDRLEADIAIVDRQADKLKQERTKWVNVVAENGMSEQQLQELEEIAAEVSSDLATVDVERKAKIYDRLRLKVSAAREDDEIVLYVGILGAPPERAKLIAKGSVDKSTINSNTAACGCTLRDL